MPDEITSNDDNTHKLVFTEAEMQMLYTMMNNIQVKGAEAIVIISGMLEKLYLTYTPLDEENILKESAD
tara:strand:- start:930 stop:1136 length:207 start_codon:yes stop_codon:yes gene_type:complete